MQPKSSIIVQAGGLGTRLRPLTNNRPKCLVPVSGETILSHAVKIFDTSRVIVIGDYLIDVIRAYVDIFFPQVCVVKAESKGTCGGLKEALSLIDDKDAVIFTWSDLLFEKHPDLDLTKSTIGLSRTFPCRYQYEEGAYTKETSASSGVAGFFVFPNKAVLADVPSEGSFVGTFLKENNYKFDTKVWLDGVHEIGTTESLKEYESLKIKSRFFNDVVLSKDSVTKKSKVEKFESLILSEYSWYRHIESIGQFPEIPKLICKMPLEIERRYGKHPYDCTLEEKSEVIDRLSSLFEKLHKHNICVTNHSDMRQMYLIKVFDRVKKYSGLIRCFNEPVLRINKKLYKNPWVNEKDVYDIFASIACDNFCLIHGDPTFSNTLWNPETQSISLFDPRGQFGSSKIVGDPLYDWAKLYYSAIDEYDRTNTGDFFVNRDAEGGWHIPESHVVLAPVFWRCCPHDAHQILLRLSTIWFSLVGYVENDIDGMNFAFLKGCVSYNNSRNEKTK